jgi:hypothetical protein
MSDGDHIRRKELHCAVDLIATAEWSQSDGASVDQRQVVGTVGAIERGNLQHLVSPAQGTLRILTAAQLATLCTHASEATATVPIAYIEYCIHPLRNGRTCMMCLAVVDENEEELDDERRSVNVVSHGQMLRLNVEEASTWQRMHCGMPYLYVRIYTDVVVAVEKFDSANIRRQLAAKKLSLVLDLDHTLLHAVRVSDLTGEIPTAGILSLRCTLADCGILLILPLDPQRISTSSSFLGYRISISSSCGLGYTVS